MKTEKPYGKGFTGFIIGLLLATLIIGGLVYVLENNRKRDFKDPIVEKELPPPEVLTPKQPAPPPAAPPQQEPASQEKIEPIEPAEPPETVNPPEEPKQTRVDEPEKPEDKPAPPPPMDRTTERKHKADNRKQADKDKNDKLTPEQILNGQAGKRQREAERRKAQAALSGQAGKPAPSGSGKGGSQSVIVQAGAYGSRDKAETQRAKLAAAGVQAEIAEASVQGKTMYRVQTAPMDKAQAADARGKLQNNGIDSFVRPAR